MAQRKSLIRWKPPTIITREQVSEWMMNYIFQCCVYNGFMEPVIKEHEFAQPTRSTIYIHTDRYRNSFKKSELRTDELWQNTLSTTEYISHTGVRFYIIYTQEGGYKIYTKKAFDEDSLVLSLSRPGKSICDEVD